MMLDLGPGINQDHGTGRGLTQANNNTPSGEQKWKLRKLDNKYSMKKRRYSVIITDNVTALLDGWMADEGIDQGLGRQINN